MRGGQRIKFSSTLRARVIAGTGCVHVVRNTVPEFDARRALNVMEFL